MNGPVPNGTLIVTVGSVAIWFAIDALSMKVLLRMLNSPVYCADAKWRVTLLPLTVGSDAWVGTPRVLAFGFCSILKVAATSAGPKPEPSLNFTFGRIVTCRSFPPFWNAYAVASHGCSPAAVASSWSNSNSGSLTMLRVPMLDETELLSYGLKSSEKVTPVVGSAIRGFPPDVVDVEVELQPAASSSAAIPTTPVNAVRFIYLSPP